MTTDEQKQAQAEKADWWKGLPEAPYSDSFKWRDGAGFEHLSTCRAWSGPDLYDNAARMIAHILETGGTPINNLPAPMPTAPASTPEATQNASEGPQEPRYEPIMPEGAQLFTVASVFHEKTTTGKDVLKVVTVEAPYNTKWGVSCFHPGEEFAGWKAWPIDSKNPVKYAPPKGAGHVVIRPPVDGGKYPDVVSFSA